MKPLARTLAAAFAFAAAPHILAAPVPQIDTLDAAAVKAGFFQYFATAMPPVDFTGSIATCTPGTISAAFQDWTLTRLNYLRALGGLGSATTLQSSLDADMQALAVYVAENYTTAPNPAKPCYTPAVAANGPLSAGENYSVDAVTLMARFYWNRPRLLAPRATAFGFGAAIGDDIGTALQPIETVPMPSAPQGFAWPRNYVPYQLLASNDCSFMLPGADLSSATVVTGRNGQTPSSISAYEFVAADGEHWLRWNCNLSEGLGGLRHQRVTISGVSERAIDYV